MEYLIRHFRGTDHTSDSYDDERLNYDSFTEILRSDIIALLAQGRKTHAMLRSLVSKPLRKHPNFDEVRVFNGIHSAHGLILLSLQDFEASQSVCASNRCHVGRCI